MDRIGDYKVIRELGSGGMGRVFLCQHPRLPLEVAIKLLFEQADERARDRFEREAVTMAALQDAHIVRVQDKGLQQGQPYIVMEYVPGEDLTALLRDAAPLPPERALEITLGILGGLAYAHSRGVVHRDIKPSNIRIGPGDQVKILDFGIAHLRDRDLTHGGATLTRVGLQPGTDDYMSPEQVKGRKVDPRSDLFATGIVLYELLAGRHPFRHRSAEATRRHIAREDPAPPRAHRPELPLPVAWLVLRALERAPESRPASAEEFADHCRALLKEFLREALAPGPDWRAAEALALTDARAVEVLAREAEHAGEPARARALYQRALALDPAADRLHDRLLGVADAEARTGELLALVREARQALDDNRVTEAEGRLQRIRLLQPEWRSNPEIERLHRDLRRSRPTAGDRTPSERGTDPGSGAHPTPGDDRLVPIRSAGEAPLPVAAAAPALPAADPGIWRPPPPITADPASPHGQKMRRVVELFEQSDYDRAALVLRDLARETSAPQSAAEFLGYWKPKIDARKIFVQAEASYKQLRRNEARQLCGRALAIDPATVRARQLLAQIEIDDEAEKAAATIQAWCEEGEALVHSVRGDLDGGTLEAAARKLLRAERLAAQALDMRADHNRARKLASHVKVYLITLPPAVLASVREEAPAAGSPVAPAGPAVAAPAGHAVAAPAPGPAPSAAEPGPAPRTPVPPAPSEEERTLARLRAEVGQGFAPADLDIAESARRALEALAAGAGTGRMPPLARLQALERSVAGLRLLAARARKERGGWAALADLAGEASRAADPSITGWTLLAERCRGEAAREALASLRPMVPGDPAALEREAGRIAAHPGLAPAAARLREECAALVAESRRLERSRREEALAAAARAAARAAVADAPRAPHPDTAPVPRADAPPPRRPAGSPTPPPSPTPQPPPRPPTAPSHRPAVIAPPRVAPAARWRPRLVVAAGLAAALAAGGLGYRAWAGRTFDVRIHVWPHGRIAAIDGAAHADLVDGTIHVVGLRRGMHEVTVEMLVPGEPEPRRKIASIDAGDGEAVIAVLSREEALRLLAGALSRDPFLAGGP